MPRSLSLEVERGYGCVGGHRLGGGTGGLGKHPLEAGNLFVVRSSVGLAGQGGLGGLLTLITSFTAALHA